MVQCSGFLIQFKVHESQFMVQGALSTVHVFHFMVQGSFIVNGSLFKSHGSWFNVHCSLFSSRFKVDGLHFMVHRSLSVNSSWFTVHGFFFVVNGSLFKGHGSSVHASWFQFIISFMVQCS